jgi:hypothetical protein
MNLFDKVMQRLDGAGQPHGRETDFDPLGMDARAFARDIAFGTLFEVIAALREQPDPRRRDTLIQQAWRAMQEHADELDCDNATFWHPYRYLQAVS